VTTDPIRRVHTAQLTHILSSPGGLAVLGDNFAVCDGNAVLVQSADQQQISSSALQGECTALAAIQDTLIVSEAGGAWVHLDPSTGTESKRYEAAAVFAFATDGTTVVGFAGQDGLLIGNASGDTPPSASSLAQDARGGMFLADGSLLVADGHQGLKHIDLSTDGGPSVLSSLETDGMVSSVAAMANGHVAVANGEWGLAVVDTAGTELALVAKLEIPGMTTDVAVNGDTIAVAGWDAVRLLDATDPTDPALVARELYTPTSNTNGRALAIETLGTHFVTAGNENASTLETQLDALAPEFSPHQRVVSIEVLEGSDTGSTGLLFYNTGKQPLIVSNIQSGDERILLCDGECGSSVAEMVAEPDGVAFLEIQTITGDNVVSVITMETNDPDEPTASIPVRVNPTLLKAGDPAPDFVMPGVYGEMEKLSSLKGQVVYLKLFNSL